MQQSAARLISVCWENLPFPEGCFAGLRPRTCAMNPSLEILMFLMWIPTVIVLNPLAVYQHHVILTTGFPSLASYGTWLYMWLEIRLVEVGMTSPWRRFHFCDVRQIIPSGTPHSKSVVDTVLTPVRFWHEPYPSFPSPVVSILRRVELTYIVRFVNAVDTASIWLCKQEIALRGTTNKSVGPSATQNKPK